MSQMLARKVKPILNQVLAKQLVTAANSVTRADQGEINPVEIHPGWRDGSPGTRSTRLQLKFSRRWMAPWMTLSSRAKPKVRH
ncbi:hypothetical protein ACNKHM_13070 [Shigella sonnei]